jgi:hypothetical protein
MAYSSTHRDERRPACERAAAISDETILEIGATSDAEVLFFDLP